MAIALVRWSVDDVKKWINTWTIHRSIHQTTISNLTKAADIYHIDGQRLIYFTVEDLKQFGLNKKDINITIKRIDALIIATYLDYMIEQRYRYNPNTKSHQKTSKNQSNHVRKEEKGQHDADEWETLQDARNYPMDKRAQRKPIELRISPGKYIQKRKEKKAAKKRYKIAKNKYIENSAENQDALQSIASNKAVHSATRSAMNDRNIQSAALEAYGGGGNNVQSNRKLIGALAQNKKVQGAVVSVAKDKKVQKAAYNTGKKHATMKNVKKVKRSILSFK